MKKTKLLLFITIILFNCAPGAKKSIEKSDVEMDEKIITEQIGIVDFWKVLNKYTISYSVPETMDGQITCVVADTRMIPKHLQKPGLKIIFSGILVSDPDLPAPRMGGEQILLLKRIDRMTSFNNR